MNESHLLEDEYVIEQSEKSGILLTNKRLKHLHWKFGKIQTKSIALKCIDSIEVKWTHNVQLFPVILILISSPLSFLLTMFLMHFLLLPRSEEMAMLFASFFVGSILPIYFLCTIRNRLIVMTKNGRKLKINIGRLSNQENFDFVNGVEKVIARQHE